MPQLMKPISGENSFKQKQIEKQPSTRKYKNKTTNYGRMAARFE